MNCEEFKERLLQDPCCKAKKFLAHREACPSCQAEWEQLQTFEKLLRTVIQQQDVESPVLSLNSTRHHPWWGSPTGMMLLFLALLAGLGGYGLVYPVFFRESLAEVVMHHVRAEPALLQQTSVLEDMAITSVLVSQGFEFHALPGAVTAAAPCRIRSSRGIHLVLQEQGRPVTVLLMPGEYLEEQQALGGINGVGWVMPERWGSMAVLAPSRPLAQVVSSLMKENLRWTGAPADRSFQYPVKSGG